MTVAEKEKKSKKKRKRMSEESEEEDQKVEYVFDVGNEKENKKKSSKSDKKVKKKKKKDKRKKEEKETNTDDRDCNSSSERDRKEKKRKKKEKKESKVKDKEEKKQRKRLKVALQQEQQSNERISRNKTKVIPFDYKYILAPMVGASELPFRLLCRKYGTQVAYTPMISSTKFIQDEDYRATEFPVHKQDRPLVCHFSANNPNEFAQAAKMVEPNCDAIDLNLGCPQRTAYVGHFGSYLLDKKDRQLICDIIRAANKAVSIPIFVKIRLLDTLDDTIELCQQLIDSGAALIAIHGRYRASWERTGPGARDGPAHLDQIQTIIQKLQHNRTPIISNGNTITYNDVVTNLSLTKAQGIMSAEGILDNPGLFLPRYGTDDQKNRSKVVSIVDPLYDSSRKSSANKCSMQNQDDKTSSNKAKRKLLKKLREIQKIEETMKKQGEKSINEDQKNKLSTKESIQKALQDLANEEAGSNDINTRTESHDGNCIESTQATEAGNTSVVTKDVTLESLYNVANDPIELAKEYIQLVIEYPKGVKLRTIVFHVRRMCRDILNQYQLMEDCISSTDIQQVQHVLDLCMKYRDNPNSFLFDKEKAKQQKEAIQRKKAQEAKRKNFEARMIRKAKREGKKDLMYYLNIGTEIPTVEFIQHELKPLSQEKQLELWKQKNHSQHCLAYHLNGNCQRGRACAFLHVDAKDSNSNTFEEIDEVAG